MAQTLEFFWDPASPYTYLASTQLEKLAHETGVGLRYRPMLLGGVFQATGNKPPGMLPAKGKHMLRDLALMGRYLKVPVEKPDSFPVHSVLSLRCALVAEQHGKHVEFSNAVMRGHWGAGLDVSKSEVLMDIAKLVELDGEALIAGTQDDAIKQQLKDNTAEAVARGAFGAPTFFLGEQMFWGCDRMDLIRAYLDGELS